jgi:hypothetical protein
VISWVWRGCGSPDHPSSQASTTSPPRIATAGGAGAVVWRKPARVTAAMTPMATVTMTAPAINSRSSRTVVSWKWAGTPRACWTVTQATS